MCDLVKVDIWIKFDVFLDIKTAGKLNFFSKKDAFSSFS